MSSAASLALLHKVLQRVFAWTDSHLHEFEAGRCRFGPPRLDVGWGEGVVDEILPADPAAHSPHCLDGARAAPPEDCGGPFGYAELLEALADPTRSEHAERLEWIGDRFDPGAFDLAATNRALARIR